MATSAVWSRLRYFWNENKAWILTWTCAAVIVLLVVHFWPQGPDPVPTIIKRQAGFSIIWPAGYQIDANTWKYLDTEKSVQFSAKKDGITTVFTEEATPLAYQNDVAAYNRFIGSLRPRANFDVPLGTVSISNFVTQGDYQVVGETGILNAKGTLVLAHPDTQLTDDQWRSLFESLKVN